MASRQVKCGAQVRETHLRGAMRAAANQVVEDAAVDAVPVVDRPQRVQDAGPSGLPP